MHMFSSAQPICLLFSAFNLLTVKVIINMYDPITIFLIVLGLVFVGLFLLVCFLPAAAAAKSLQSCPTLCDSIDGSPPGSLIPGILQVRTLELVASSFSSA